MLGPVGIAMQLCLGAFCFGSLFCKRAYEYPKRSLRIFLLDISKQGFSAGMSHVINTFAAIILQGHSSHGDGCDWYLLNFIFEVVFVLMISLVIHSAITAWAEKNEVVSLQSGVYLSIHDSRYIYMYKYEDLDKHINYRVWCIQVFMWLLIVCIAKTLQFAIEIEFSNVLIDIAIACISWLNPHPDMKVFAVVIFIPTIMNVVQFWIQDNFLQGTAFIEEQKRKKKAEELDNQELHIFQDGFIDFQANRRDFRK